ncbi:MAG: hypothetical protein Q7S87_18090 [Agitococcus sp.]|nr:hypothetical protein [Agitococcus sp.]
MNTVIKEIELERNRQVSQLGWTQAHDVQDHSDGVLAKAAAIYADPRPAMHEDNTPVGWPKDWAYKPKSRRKDLIRAAALIVAEVERLDSLPKFSKEESLGSRSSTEIVAYLEAIENPEDAADFRASAVEPSVAWLETKYRAECPNCFADNEVDESACNSGQESQAFCSVCYKSFFFRRG